MARHTLRSDVVVLNDRNAALSIAKVSSSVETCGLSRACARAHGGGHAVVVQRRRERCQLIGCRFDDHDAGALGLRAGRGDRQRELVGEVDDAADLLGDPAS